MAASRHAYRGIFRRAGPSNLTIDSILERELDRIESRLHLGRSDERQASNVGRRSAVGQSVFAGKTCFCGHSAKFPGVHRWQQSLSSERPLSASHSSQVTR